MTASKHEMGAIVAVVCICLPDGSNLWCRASRGAVYFGKVLDKWKADHPDYVGCSCGFVELRMPENDYKAIEVTSFPLLEAS